MEYYKGQEENFCALELPMLEHLIDDLIGQFKILETWNVATTNYNSSFAYAQL
ncbi:MAG: hypothetical protein ACD_19C00187G0009 [uncultured bacterium]|nr:MAG: hypothetical protein ACD_19C00187G0009 [uncultured bacterium]